MKTAVICSRYPAVSHTFIQREVRSLRGLGLDVHTFAVRRAAPEALLTAADADEARRTVGLLPVGPGRLLRAHARAFAAGPAAYMRVLGRSLRLSPGTPRGTVWRLFYFAEAVLMWHECRRRGVHHVHAHFADVASDVAMLTAMLGDAIDGGGWSWSLTFHGFAQLWGVRENRVAEKVRSARFVACVSDFLRSQLMLWVDEDQWEKLHLVRTGVDVHAFAPTGMREPDGHELEIAAVGRLVRGKGFSLLLEAVAELPAARLSLAGAGPDRDTLERKARALGIADRTRFLGAIGHDAIGDLYAGADVFCLPSFSEGVPVVLMEAMAAGLPVVTTRVKGIPELVTDGESGLVVAPGRADALTAALHRLQQSPELRARLGEAGRERVRRAFSAADGAQRMAQLLRGERPDGRADYSTNATPSLTLR